MCGPSFVKLFECARPAISLHSIIITKVVVIDFVTAFPFLNCVLIRVHVRVGLRYSKHLTPYISVLCQEVGKMLNQIIPDSYKAGNETAHSL